MTVFHANFLVSNLLLYTLLYIDFIHLFIFNYLIGRYSWIGKEKIIEFAIPALQN